MKKGTTKSLGNKHKFDKFYTKEGISKKYIDMLEIGEYDIIIEPSAGSGSFSGILKGMSKKVYAYDLEPEGEGIIKSDWFEVDKEQFKGKTLVIGNPPFGNNGSLAMKFIEESQFADTIAFILPRGFKKDSVKNRVPDKFHLVIEEDLPKNSFTLEGEDYDVPCVFQVWEKRKTDRDKVVYNTESKYVKFVSKEESNFRVQRVGGNSGKAFKNIEASKSSNYFIRNTSKYTDDLLIELINNLEYPSRDYTTGPRSISKGEFINELEKELNKQTIN